MKTIFSWKIVHVLIVLILMPPWQLQFNPSKFIEKSTGRQFDRSGTTAKRSEGGVSWPNLEDYFIDTRDSAPIRPRNVTRPERISVLDEAFSIAGYSAIPMPIGAQFDLAPNFTNLVHRLFFPRVSMGSLGTSLSIQNPGSQAVAFEIHYLDQDGNNSLTVFDTIGQHGSRIYQQLPYAGFEGSAIIVSTIPLLAVASVEKTGTDSFLSYDAQSSPGTQIVLPKVMKDWNGRNTEFWVQNTSSLAANISINYHPTSAGNNYTITDNIPPSTSRRYRQSDNLNLGSSFLGWAEVISSEPLAIVVEEWDANSDRAAAYSGANAILDWAPPPSGAQGWRAFIPRQQRLLNGFSSFTGLINPTSYDIDYQAAYYNSEGILIWSDSKTISPKTSIELPVDTNPNLPSGFDGSLILESTGPLVTSDSLQNPTASEGDHFSTVVSDLYPDLSLGLPYVTSMIDEGLSTQFSVQNASPVSADIPISYYDRSGATSASVFDTIPVNGVKRYSTSDVSELGTNWEGSAVIVSDQPIIGDVLLQKSQVIDIGFRPNPNGYQFPNYNEVKNDDFTIDDMRLMFGDDAVCQMVNPICQPIPAAEQWKQLVNGLMADTGHCDGFTTTSLRFFKSIDDPAVYQNGAAETYDLQLSSARRHIAYYWALQLANPVALARDQALQTTPTEVLSQLESAMSNNAPDPTTLIFYDPSHTSAHSVTPYAIQYRGNEVYWVRVYDNNYPNDKNRFVEINALHNTWTYNLGWTTWSGDASTPSIGIIPISVYAQQPICPWCYLGGAQSSALSSAQVWLNGQGHLLISDAIGRRIGFVGNQFVDEIPEAFGSVPAGGLGISAEPIYSLPQNDSYSILMSGQTLTQTKRVAVSQFGPGYAATIDNVLLKSTSNDELKIAPDGTQIAYHASDNTEPTLKMDLDRSNSNEELQLQGADIGAGQTITATANLSNGMLIFDNSHTNGGAYNLLISLLDENGKHIFTHLDISVDPTDTHYLNFGAWDGSGSLSLRVDHGSDGSIDDTITLVNQANRLFLPILTRD
jgi:hypothetical protein